MSDAVYWEVSLFFHVFFVFVFFKHKHCHWWAIIRIVPRDSQVVVKGYLVPSGTIWWHLIEHLYTAIEDSETGHLKVTFYCGQQKAQLQRIVLSNQDPWCTDEVEGSGEVLTRFRHLCQQYLREFGLLWKRGNALDLWVQIALGFILKARSVFSPLSTCVT